MNFVDGMPTFENLAIVRCCWVCFPPMISIVNVTDQHYKREVQLFLWEFILINMVDPYQFIT